MVIYIYIYIYTIERGEDMEVGWVGKQLIYFSQQPQGLFCSRLCIIFRICVRYCVHGIYFQLASFCSGWLKVALSWLSWAQGTRHRTIKKGYCNMSKRWLNDMSEKGPSSSNLLAYLKVLDRMALLVSLPKFRFPERSRQIVCI